MLSHGTLNLSHLTKDTGTSRGHVDPSSYEVCTTLFLECVHAVADLSGILSWTKMQVEDSGYLSSL